MEKEIIKICKDLEKKHNIKILFAVENGSRAWRMSSKDSDYDVRFVFVRDLRDYIQINKPREVIQVSFDKNLNVCLPEEALIDVSGFDIFKYIKLLSDSNPTTIEWLTSDIVYYGKQNETFKKFAEENFSRISLYNHYKSMCRNNYLKYLKSGSDITYKRYLYVFRGLLNAKWVAKKDKIPPISFMNIMDKSKNLIPSDVLNKLKEIVELKSKGKEKDIIQNIVKIDNFIEDFLKDNSETPTQKSHSTLNELNEELRRVVLLE